MNSVEVSTQKSWTTRRERKNRRLQRLARYCSDRVLDSGKIIEAMEELVEPGDRICLEGNNQKQADFLSRKLAQVDPERIHGLHLLISVLSRPEHMDLFDRGIASSFPAGRDGRQITNSYRRDPHLPRTLWALLY
jgi:malonate decarboxylase alpha subunit